MVAAFGSGRPRKWSNRQLLENHPRIRVGGLRGHSEVTLSYGGKTQIVQIEKSGPSVVVNGYVHGSAVPAEDGVGSCTKRRALGSVELVAATTTDPGIAT